MRTKMISVVVLLLGMATRTPLTACPYSIRDSAFISGTAASAYELQILVKGNGADSAGKDRIGEWLSAAASTWLDHANVEARVVDVSDPGARDALPDAFSIPSALPAAILVSPRREAMRLSGIAPGKFSLDAVMTTALEVVRSPLRKNIQRRLAKSWCVGLLVEGTSADENARASQAFEQAARSITGQSTEMGQVVTAGPELLRVAHDSAEEKVLLWSLGLETSGDENVPVRLVLLVGRGERRGPLLEGDGVTSKKLLELFTMLGRSCSCTTDETWLSGPSLPLEWSEEIKALVRTELGFDPRNPEALGAIKGVLEGASAASPLSEVALGYSETFLELEVEEASRGDSMTESSEIDIARNQTSLPRRDARSDVTEVGSAAPHVVGSGMPSTPAPEPTAEEEEAGGSFRAGHVALLALSGLALLVLAGATFVVLRRRPEG